MIVTHGVYFRGTQDVRTEQTVRGVPSWTPCLEAAIVWSALPANVWSSSDAARKARFAATSTISAARILPSRPLHLGGADESIGAILRKLSFMRAGGATEEEALSIFSYLHYRLIGRRLGGPFKYRVFDDDGEPVDESTVPLSFSAPQTLISMARDDFEFSSSAKQSLSVADAVAADVFVFADCPVVQRVAARLGYDALVYPDVFAGAEYALRDLMGMRPEDVDCLDEDEDPFSGGEDQWYHETLRPLVPAIVQPLWSRPALQVLETYRRERSGR